MSRLRPILANLALTAVATVLAFFVAEACMRYAGHHVLRNGEQIWAGQIYNESDPPVGYSPRPGASQHLVMGGEYSLDIRINSLGMRDVEHRIEPDKGRRRILVLGDSFMFGIGVAMEETLPRRLEEMQPGIEVVNAGVVGYDLGQEYLLYKDRAFRFAPDIVVLAFFLNDLPGHALMDVQWDDDGLPRTYARSAAAQRKKLDQAPRGLVGAASFWFRSRSLVYTLVRKRIESLRAEPLPARDTTSAPEPGDPENPFLTAFSPALDGAVQNSWAGAFRILAALRREVESRGARLAVMLIPASIQLNDAAFSKWSANASPGSTLSRHLPQQRMNTWCDENGVPCLDLMEVFEGTKPESTYRVYDAHWTREGHALAARALRDFLTSRGLI